MPGRGHVTRYVADVELRLWRGRDLALGGTPWGVVRLGPVALELLRRAAGAGPQGSPASTAAEQGAARRLVARGLLHPVPAPAPPAESATDDRGSGAPPASPERGTPPAVAVVVPSYGRPGQLDRCLASLAGLDVTVVDDGSPGDEVVRVAAAHGVSLVRHPVNRGPAAARNTGLAATDAPVVAFLDDDCAAGPGWLDPLVSLFDDERVVAVAPRVAPTSNGSGGPLLRRYEAARSALDMGPHPALVRPGGRLGFLPSAALLLRRSAAGTGFDESMRLGEDVDLVWRLAAEGGHVRYAPSVTVAHESLTDLARWLRRRHEYGTSAAALEDRHPGALAPFRPSPWSVAALVAAMAGRWGLAFSIMALASALLARRLQEVQVDPTVALVVVGQGVVADWLALGHVMRREWWPLGAATLIAAPRVGAVRLHAAAMLVPLALEWWQQRPDLDPCRYLALRLLDDAAYGSGVVRAAVRAQSWSVLAPRLRRVRRPLQAEANEWRGNERRGNKGRGNEGRGTEARGNEAASR